jgi:hypothetical protein
LLQLVAFFPQIWIVLLEDSIGILLTWVEMRGRTEKSTGELQPGYLDRSVLRECQKSQVVESQIVQAYLPYTTGLYHMMFTR